MSDKHIKRVKQYLEDINDERDDLFKNVEKLVNTVTLQVQGISMTQAPLSTKEALLMSLTKVLVLFSELNHSVLKCLEKSDTPAPVPVNTHSTQQIDSSNVQELQDYFKLDDMTVGNASYDFSKEGPKIPNNLVQNDSYIRKPLDDTTLKAICSNFINKNSLTDNTSDASPAENTPNSLSIDNPLDSNTENITAKTDCLIEQHERRNIPTSNLRLSPTFSYRSNSSIYQHPLLKFSLPTKIPDQYDTEDLEKVKENMKYISKKMGFDSEGFAQMTSQFDKPVSVVSPVNCRYEEPVKDVPNEVLQAEELLSSGITTDTEHLSTAENSSVETSESEKPKKINNEAKEPVLDASTADNQVADAVSRNTGAIRKQKRRDENLIEFSGSASDSESCEKVSSWLTRNSESEKQALSFIDPPATKKEHVKDVTAVDKLGNMKRCDRNEEAREKARADMPDLRLIPVEVPQVIKNNLNSDSSSSGKTRKCRKKQSVKKVNEGTGVYEMRPMELPQNGALCVFSHIVSPNEFYLQIIDDVSSRYLDAVSEKINEKFSKKDTKFLNKQEAFAKLGKYCYGYIWGERNSWHRLHVLDWKLGCSTDEVEVQSLEYGFKCTTSYTYLRELTPELAQIPRLAVKCHFPLLYPPGSTFSNRLTKWPETTREALYDIAGLNADVTQVSKEINIFEVVFAMLEGDSLAVDLAQYLEPKADTLGQLLIDMGMAVEIIDDYEDDPALGEFLEDVDELEKAENLNEFLLGYDAQDEARICRFTRKDGTCYKGKHCKLEHIPLKDGYTTDTSAVFYTAINDLIFPNKGDVVQVLVTSYIDSCTYLVQLIRNPVKKENSNLVMDKDISDLMDAMNHPKMSAKYSLFKIYPAVGEVILAFHPIAKKWIRVAVRELNKNGDESTLEVYSVDFGEEFLINYRHIRQMQEEFMHVPFQVIQIYLENYQHRKACNVKKAKTFFDKHLAYRTFLAHIKSSDLPYKVSLTTLKGADIGPTLISEGLAEKRKIDVYITEDKEKRKNFDLE